MQISPPHVLPRHQGDAHCMTVSIHACMHIIPPHVRTFISGVNVM